MTLNDPSPRLCCIGGTGRSGTTILKKIFACHPKVTAVPEGRITVDPDGIIDYYSSLKNNWSPYLFHRKTRRLLKFLRSVQRKPSLANRVAKKISTRLLPRNSLFRINCPNYSRYVEELEKELIDFQFSGRWVGFEFLEKEEMLFSHYDTAQMAQVLSKFYWKVVRSFCEQKKSTHYIEDNTWTFIHFNEYLELIPSAKLVHIHRDPRDVVASYMKQTWMPSDAAQSATVVASLFNRWFEVRNSLGANRFVEMSLYSLVDSTEESLKELCKFWDLPWDDSLLSLNLNQSNRGRWKNDIPPSQIDQVQKTLQPYLDEYGY